MAIENSRSRVFARAVTYNTPCEGATIQESRIPENGTYGLKKGTKT